VSRLCTEIDFFVLVFMGYLVGATIVCIDILAFSIFYLIGRMKR